MQLFKFRTKYYLILNIPRQCYTMKKWISTQAVYGSYFSIFPIPHEYYEKELPDEYIVNNMNKITHIFDRKDIIIETIQNNDN